MSNPEANQTQDNISPELNTLISEEVLRARVQKIIGAPKPQRWYWRMMDHQVFAIVLGFLLTWLLGTILTKSWENSKLETARQIEQERRETEARIAAFTDFLGTVYEQHARSSLVDDAFRNGAPIGELASLIQSEQEIFAKSESKAGVLTFTIRQLVPPSTYEKINNAMESGLIEPLRQARRNHGYMYYEMASRRTNEWKQVAALTSQMSTCSATLTQAIWYNAIAPKSDDATFTQRKAESLKQMGADCTPH
jgi:hypothetical protein